MAFSPYNVPDLLEQIQIAGKDVDNDDGESRRQCLQAARSLVFALETPSEAILRNTWAEVCTRTPEK